MVYGTYNYSYWGESKPTFTSRGCGPHIHCRKDIRRQLMQGPRVISWDIDDALNMGRFHEIMGYHQFISHDFMEPPHV